MIDELEKKEQALSQRLQELEAGTAHDPSTVDTFSPDDRHTVKSIAASSPATREGASIKYVFLGKTSHSIVPADSVP
jgi:hypothetical protein